MIEDREMVSQYIQKVYDETGNVVNSPLQTHLPDFDKTRSVRLSKARAVLSIKDDIHHEEDKDDMKEIQGSSRQRSNRNSKDTSKQSKKEPKKPKAKLQMELQIKERKARQELRAKIDPRTITGSLNHIKPKNCCLMCAASTFRNALKDDDMEEFKAAFLDHTIPYSTHEDSESAPDLIGHAIALGKTDFAEHAKKQMEAKKDVSRPSVPRKYKVYDSNTGSNRNFGYYGNQSYR